MASENDSVLHGEDNNVKLPIMIVVVVAYSCLSISIWTLARKITSFCFPENVFCALALG